MNESRNEYESIMLCADGISSLEIYIIYICCHSQSCHSNQTLHLCFSALTATVSSIGVQGVVGGTAALGTSGCSQAQVGTVAVVMGALVGTVLAGGVEHQYV